MHEQSVLKVFGRRKSRPLRIQKQSIYDDVLPRLKEPLAGAFWQNQSHPLFLEIGFGSGEHLLQKAIHEPYSSFIGAEPFMNGVAALVTKIKEENIQNINIWDDDIHLLLNKIPVQEIFDAVFLLFADPWPKKRHFKRRFVQDETIKKIHTLLKPNAQWYIATDHESLREWVLEHFEKNNHLFKQIRDDIFIRPPESEWPKTRYETKAEKEGRKSAFMIYEKI
jgi:tRNA (guanine-N7-)-methyltransferase